MSELTVFILNDFGDVNGGASQVAISSAIGLARTGHRVVFFSAVPPILPDLINSGVEVICAHQYELLKDPVRIRAAVKGLWNMRVAKMVSAALDRLEKGNTIVHLHSWTKGLSSSAVRAARGKGFQIICTLHDYFAACPNGGFYNYPKTRICTLKPLSLACILEDCDARSYSQKVWRSARQYFQQSLGGIPGKIDYFISVSKFSEQILRPFIPHAQWYHVPNPIQTDKKPPVAVSRNKMYTMVGQLTRGKGTLLFAQAALKGGFDVLFVGGGECREEILSTNPHVRITGWVGRGAVDEYLTKSRVLVFPSLFYETQGLSVLEAASRGVPAIVADTNAARDFVEDGITGLWFKGGNSYDLIKKMNMLRDDDLVRSLGRSAYEKYWNSPFSIERHVANLLDVYRHILKVD
jgi:glycosyltransferase involved in cell wall biosynthesis